LKIWSKNGNIRSNLIQGDKSIYCVTWSPESDSILYCCDRIINIKSMSSNKQISWKAHDGVVLKADWNPSNNLIISGG
jgi:intraflagellar transport protein 80